MRWLFVFVFFIGFQCDSTLLENSHSTAILAAANAIECGFPLYGSGECSLPTANAAGNMWTINNEDSFVTVLVNIVEHDESEIVLSYSLKTTWAVDGELDNSIITIFNLSDKESTANRFGSLFITALLCMLCMTLGQKRLLPIFVLFAVFALVPVVNMADPETIRLTILIPRSNSLALALHPSETFEVTVACTSCAQLGAAFTCGDGYFKSGDKCAVCNVVKDCKSGVLCSSISDSRCEQCEDGFWLDGSGRADVCTPCNNLCSVCTGSNVDQCKRCVEGHYLIKGTTCTACSASCAPGTYESVECSTYSNRVCSPCSTGCNTCTGGHRTECHSCKNGFYLATNSCTACNSVCTTCTGPSVNQCNGCKAGYYLSGTTCTVCDAACATCQSAGTTLCGECNVGFYLAGSECIACDARCATCTGNSGTIQCSRCKTGSYLDGTECKDTIAASIPALASEYSWASTASSTTACGTTTYFKGVSCNDAKTTVTAINIDVFVTQLDVSGSIPAAIGNLPSLESIRIVGSSITGTVPATLANLKKLTHLSLFSNELTSLAPEVGNIPSLKNLILGNNKITGTIPTNLGKLTVITYIDLSTNLFTGTIPTELGNAASLARLELQGNDISGKIPAEFTQKMTIKVSSGLCGAIPASVNLIHIDGSQITALPACA